MGIQLNLRNWFFLWSLCFSTLLAASTVMAASGEFDIREEALFRKMVPPDAKLQKLAGDMKFVEGPVWVPSLEALIFSDIPADELKSWIAAKGLQTFRKPSHNANGNTVDKQGRLITCEHSGRRVSRLEKDGSVKALVEQVDGKKFNSPNDVAVKSDGSMWFTDPDYGLGGNKMEVPGCFVYRFDPASGKIAPVVKDFDKPNGICFSPDESKLYVADSGRPRHIRVFDVQKDGTLSAGRVFCSIDKGGPDGIRCAPNGCVFSSAGDGVQIFAEDGKLVGKILVPETPANLCFGGADGQTLFITARTSLYSIPVKPKP